MEKNSIKYEIGAKQFDCPVALSSYVINGKWKLQIINQLSFNKKMRYSALKSEIENVSEKMLIQHLRELESDGLIHRKVYPVVPPMVEYSLTKAGQDFIPVIIALRAWGEQFQK
ncbi:MAG: helix-turn-helix domain-containing protein [Arachidicoccus sp.]|nr:helix-turn-helix domain-containing protein [Arachidicoccus sp.]